MVSAAIEHSPVTQTTLGERRTARNGALNSCLPGHCA